MVLQLLGLLGAAAVIGGVAWWFFFRQPQKEQSFFFRCPSCGQKLRYLARKAGKLGKCPRCNKGCTFPSTPQEAAASALALEEGRVRFGRRSQTSNGKASVS